MMNAAAVLSALTKGAIQQVQKIQQGTPLNSPDFQPILQVQNIKAISQPGKEKRIRIKSKG